MDRLHNVVVGVDFSACSIDALAQAKRIAAWNRARMRAVHVIDTVAMLDLQEALSMVAVQIQDGLVEDARAQWDALAATHAWIQDIPFEAVVTNAVSELARRVGPAFGGPDGALLVLGVHGRGKSGGAGAVASGCVRHAPSSVLLTREGKPGRFGHVVACVDFSPTSREAVDQAIRVAAQDSSILHVVHVHTVPRSLFGFTTRVEPSADVAARHRNDVRERLHAFCDGLGHATVWSNARFVVVDHVSHARGILDYAKGVDAELVVLGVRGRSNLRDILLGSTAERVVRESPCAVLTVRPAQA
jgi:nucleotide-binding universal stress UspA family protein